ncbi:uncharacterized protein LOC133286412 [Gastrolobium bilobum]|uniref:uncharacterized protein LOC133286412 n=1 Tax=Gastrolobium bilobum TaxID=150636 RepID=UPI002AB06FBC|nr:uncharacterized protein LOC133286412 [Gastrolobium bilobum]
MYKINQHQIWKNFNKYQFLRRTLQFAFSVSIFAFFVWYSSSFFILPQSFNAYFSTCPFSIFIHTLERRYMFLICNSILAFLAKSTLLTSSPSTSPFDIEFQASNPFEIKESVSEKPVFPQGSFLFLENAPFMVGEELEQVKKQEEYYEEVSEAEGEEHDTLFMDTEGRENEASIAEEKQVEDKDEEDEERGTGSGIMVTQDDEIEDTTMETNIDELNRKCEEFIRKMKEEIRIKAQRNCSILHA